MALVVESYVHFCQMLRLVAVGNPLRVEPHEIKLIALVGYRLGISLETCGRVVLRATRRFSVPLLWSELETHAAIEVHTPWYFLLRVVT